MHDVAWRRLRQSRSTILRTTAMKPCSERVRPPGSPSATPPIISSQVHRHDPARHLRRGRAEHAAGDAVQLGQRGRPLRCDPLHRRRGSDHHRRRCRCRDQDQGQGQGQRFRLALSRRAARQAVFVVNGGRDDDDVCRGGLGRQPPGARSRGVAYVRARARSLSLSLSLSLCLCQQRRPPVVAVGRMTGVVETGVGRNTAVWGSMW